ncbi:type I secretion system permease/ATPase [Brucella pseudogrignonensis]|jgi:ATP-binding cassette subfamily C protein LapB|uniref:Type I secretion system ATPase family protein n=2 Tax=Brucella pseudogrignonensis TaxID=419475 RepID=A0A256GQZ4_9HYPH|nr:MULTISPECIES: type I secretion system permease/ATPase [Brucella]EMG53229.1 type I secretion system ATPase [Ochrobactrum sp. CDB2]MBO1023247.1 type I secretion system permease/ATPase [Ochrobactrum sp. SD129]EMG53998.1 type I secretion system ATPase [Ochrobactrum sp. CDB2]KAB2692150.1 type I secretion system permease/ATPase [Brucella pseudogrignonensis]MCD4513750.1 type I secretion system permease/ATPase [Brucella pseudogrignonensis]
MKRGENPPIIDPSIELGLIGEQPKPEAPSRFNVEDWLEALELVAKHYRMPVSVQGTKLAAAADLNIDDKAKIRAMARHMGLGVRLVEPTKITLSTWHLPFVLMLKDKQLAVVHTLSKDGQASVWLSGEEGLEQPFALKDLLAETESVVLARPSKTVPDARVDAYIKPYEENWLRKIIFRDIGSYSHVLVASLIANTLGLAGILFSMQVYDRVVPAQSFNTLYVLFSGVLLAIFFDFMMRRARMGIIDMLGKQTDLQMSDVVFGHALRVRNRARPTSTGSFIAQLRDVDQVRELLTSTTVSALADLPFFFLFLVIYSALVGWMVFIPLGALVLLILPGLFLQRRLRAYANAAMREASLRNAMLVETVQGIEDIKGLQAEDRFQQQWNHFNAVTGEAQIRLRALTNSLSVWTQNVQGGVYALTVFVGAPLIISGDMTTGALVGASILGSRMLAPMGQLSQIMGRLQHARIAKRGLDQLMQMPVDHPDSETRIHCPKIDGSYRLKDAIFRYGDENSTPVLLIKDLKIKHGDRIAVLGRNGAGKSTLLLALSGLLDAAEGEVLLDDLALPQIDPADVRRDVGLLTQNSRLFFGTLRENITMGASDASDAEIQRVLAMVGADGFVRRLQKGLEHLVQEGGGGLSGGQKQAILLARLLIRDPSVVLLDEPTSTMDEATERHFIEQFAKWSVGRTVVIATHRMRVLELVQRLIVVENGQVALDDSKERGLQTLLGMSKVETPKQA